MDVAILVAIPLDRAAPSKSSQDTNPTIAIHTYAEGGRVSRSQISGCLN